MINIASSQPVHWPVSPPAAAVAPVAAVTAVAPTQRSQGDGQSGLGSGRQTPSHASSEASQKKAPEQEKPVEASNAAPILPRDQPKEGQEPRATQSQADAKQEARDAQAAEDERAAQKLKLLDVLSTVWKASAAVVDNALGLNDSALDGASAENGVRSADAAARGQTKSAREVNVDQPVLRENGSAPILSEPPLAYTEHGASEWSALELGRLVSKRA